MTKKNWTKFQLVGNSDRFGKKENEWLPVRYLCIILI